MIENTQVVKFTNEQARILADAMLSAYRTACVVIQFYYANPSLGDTLTTGIAEVIDDGATMDGRPIATGNSVLGIITRASELKADMEANNNAKLNTLLQLAVNGQSRI